jgi:hypothetical protein
MRKVIVAGVPERCRNGHQKDRGDSGAVHWAARKQG